MQLDCWSYIQIPENNLAMSYFSKISKWLLTLMSDSVIQFLTTQIFLIRSTSPLYTEGEDSSAKILLLLLLLLLLKIQLSI